MTITDADLLGLLRRLGVCGLLAYLGEIHWPFESARKAGKKRTKALCPRCRVIAQWVDAQWNDFARRAKAVAEGGQEAKDESSDVFVSSHLRTLVKELEKHCGSGGGSSVVGVVVPTGSLCFMLWRLLCTLEGMWRTGVSKDGLENLQKRLLGLGRKVQPTAGAVLSICAVARLCDLRFAILLRLRLVTCDCTCDCTCDLTCACNCD